MKITLLAIATAFITMFTATGVSAQQSQLNPGDNLPSADMVLKNANGKAASMKGSAKENGLLVMFSCNTCPFVIRNAEMTHRTMEYAASHKIGMVIINSNEAQRGDADAVAAMERFAKSQRYTVPYLVDENSKLADQFGANHTPEVFLFDKAGKLVYKGAMNDNPGDPASFKKMFIEDAITAMIAGKPVDPNVTKSVGCSIKRKA